MVRKILFFLVIGSFLGEGCTFDVSGLGEGQTGQCGDGELDPGEQCDGIEFLTTCEQLGFWGGHLACQLDCTIDDSGCVEGCGECVPPTKRCVDDAVHTCVMRTDGCGYFQPEVDCGIIRQWCVASAGDATCAATCEDQCVAGTRACSPDGTALEGCVEVPAGDGSLCLVWRTLRRCGEAGCVEGSAPRCDEPCEDVCALGEERCASDGLGRERCSIGYAGCLDWLPLMPSCEAGTQVCELVAGAAGCSCHVCEAGTKRCSQDGTDVLFCSANGEGCTSWTTQFQCDQISEFFRCAPDQGFICAIYGNTCATALPVDPQPLLDASTDQFSSYFTNNETFTDPSCGPVLSGAVEAFIQVHVPAGGTVRVAQESETGPVVRWRIQVVGACGSSFPCLAQGNQELIFTSFLEQDVIVSAEVDPTSVHTTNDVDVVIERLANDCTDVETEVNDTPGDADQLAAQALESWGWCSRLLPTNPFSADVDCLAFTLPNPGRRFELETSDLLDPEVCVPDVQIRLYKFDGTLLATSVATGTAPCTRVAAEEPGMEPLIALPPATYRACVARAPLAPTVDVVTRLRYFPPPATPVATSFFTCPATGWSARAQSSAIPGASWTCDVSGTRFMRLDVADPELGRYYLMSPLADLSTASHAVLTFDLAFASTAMSASLRVVASTDDFVSSQLELAAWTTATAGRQTVFVPAHQLAGLPSVAIAFILDVQMSLPGATSAVELDEVTLYVW